MECRRRLQNQTGLSDLDSKPNFNVVIAYEDFETGKIARRTYDYLAQHLGGECQFTNEMWKFDILDIPRLRELAARDAKAADIIIISCHGVSPLSETVKEWIETWLDDDVRAIALVALFDSPDASPETKRIRDYLAQVATRGHIEFFAQPDHWPGREQPAGTIQFFPPRGAALDDRALSQIIGLNPRNQTLSHWGINE
jgi:hypothetical protein